MSAKATKKAASTAPTAKDFDLIRYPLVTEKSTKLLETANAYVFIVSKKAKKPEIKTAIENVYEVKVTSVNTIVMKGKNKVFKGRLGRRSDVKKAIVRLEPNDKIDLGIGV